MGSRATDDEHQLLASGGVEEQLDRTFRLPCFKKGTGECGGYLGRVEVAVGILAQVDALLTGGERELHVPGGERDDRAAGEGPHQRVCVPKQARRLDPTVEQLGGL